MKKILLCANKKTNRSIFFVIGYVKAAYSVVRAARVVIMTQTNVASEEAPNDKLIEVPGHRKIWTKVGTVIAQESGLQQREKLDELYYQSKKNLFDVAWINLASG